MTVTGRLEAIKYSSDPDKNIYDSKNRLLKKNNKEIPNSKWKQQASCDFFYSGKKIDSVTCSDFKENIISIQKYVYHNGLLTNEIVLDFWEGRSYKILR